MNFSDLIQTVLIYALPVIFAITLHEAAHGYVAHRLGDNTAWMMGRVTLNPMPHIDPMGTIVIPAMLYVVTGGTFLFGYARPVPVNFGRLHHPKRDMIWVSFAGPAINFIQALVWLLAFYLLNILGVTEAYFLKMALAGVVVNVSMFVFNLSPCPLWMAVGCWWACCHGARPCGSPKWSLTACTSCWPWWLFTHSTITGWGP